MSSRQGYHGPTTYEGKTQSGTTGEGERVGWYDATVTSIPDEGRELLESYSGLAADDVLPHVVAIRDRAFKVWSYACIGQVRFLAHTLPRYAYHGPVLAALRDGANFLDAGCCFGQELRFLAHREGVPGERLFGFDLEPAFVDFGYDLFRDRGRFGATLLSGDLLAAPGEEGARELDGIAGRMDVVHVASVLHVFDWDHMLRAAKRLVELTRAQKGALIVGNQMGSSNPGEYPMPTAQGRNYRHNEESMARFWKQVGDETGTSWEVQSGLFHPQVIKDNAQHSWAKADPGLGMIWFMITRQ